MANGAAGCGTEYDSIPPITLKAKRMVINLDGLRVEEEVSLSLTGIKQGFRCPFLNSNEGKGFACTKFRQPLEVAKNGHPFRCTQCTKSV